MRRSLLTLGVLLATAQAAGPALSQSIVLHAIPGPYGCGFERSHHETCQYLAPQMTLAGSTRQCVDVYLDGAAGASVAQFALRLGEGWEFVAWSNGNIRADASFAMTIGRDLIVCAALDSVAADSMQWVGTAECISGSSGSTLDPVIAGIPSGSAFVDRSGEIVTLEEGGFQPLVVDGGNLAGCGVMGKRGGSADESGEGDAGAITKRWIPNPLRKGSLIEWSADRAPIMLEVYDVGGRLLRTVRDGGQHGGFRFAWDGRADNGRTLGTGLYLLRISQGQAEWTRKVLSIQ